MLQPSNRVRSAAYPEIDRLFLVLWYIPLGITLHSLAAISGAPNAYQYFADNALLPVYQTVFRAIVPLNVPLFATTFAITELILGLLLLGKGVAVKIGLLLSAVFQILLIPTSPIGIINVLLAIMALLLVQHEFDRALLDVFVFRREDLAHVKS
jgi:hypothetical protein